MSASIDYLSSVSFSPSPRLPTPSGWEEPYEIEFDVDVKKIIRIYRDYIETRYNLWYRSQELDEKSLGFRKSDTVKKDEYIRVLELLSLGGGSVSIAYKVKDEIQGVLKGKLHPESKTLSIACLITAPWNINLAAPNYEPGYVVRKGVGRVLMQQAYLLAQRCECRALVLRPMSDSLGFYERIGMRLQDGDMVLDVDPSACPPPLFPEMVCALTPAPI